MSESSGGGAVVHADGTLEPVRRPAHEFRVVNAHLAHKLLPVGTGD